MISFQAGTSEEKLMEVGLDAGAHDVRSNDNGTLEVHTTLETFGSVQDALKAAGLEPQRAEMTMLPSTEVDLDLEGAQTLLKLTEHLEELDDVQNVYTNGNISDEIAAQL